MIPARPSVSATGPQIELHPLDELLDQRLHEARQRLSGFIGHVPQGVHIDWQHPVPDHVLAAGLMDAGAHGSACATLLDKAAGASFFVLPECAAPPMLRALLPRPVGGQCQPRPSPVDGPAAGGAASAGAAALGRGGSVGHGTEAPFANAVLDEAVLKGGRLSGVCLDGASLQRADVSDARLEQAQCNRLQAAGLIGINSVWIGARLNGVDLRDTRLRHSDWRGSQWQDVEVHGGRPGKGTAETAHASFWGGLRECPAGAATLWPTWRQLPLGAVQALAYSPEGRYIASGDDDGSLRLWDAASGQELRRFEGHGGYVLSVAYSRDGHLSFGGVVLTMVDADANSVADHPRFEARVLASGEWITLHADGAHTASDADPDSLEWLVYEELPATPPDPAAPPDLFPTLHRATNVPWLRRPVGRVTPTR